MKKKKIIRLVTHDGIMHSDEILACALLVRYYKTIDKEIEIKGVRTRNPYIIKEEKRRGSVIFDVGGGELDHHQVKTVENGRELSSLGKLWRQRKNAFIKVFKLDEIAWSRIDQELIKEIDVADTTGTQNLVTRHINEYKNLYGCKKDSVFRDLVKQYVSRWDLEIRSSQDNIKSSLWVKKELEKLDTITIKGKIGVISNKYLPYDRERQEKKLDFLAFPVISKKYEGIQVNSFTFKLKCPEGVNDVKDNSRIVSTFQDIPDLL